MSRTDKLFLKFILIVITTIGVVFCILNFRNNNGDPLINLVFSKSFGKGFFYYGNEGPKSGSTSPLFVMLIAPCYLFFKNPPLILIKILYFFLYLVSAYLFILLSQKIYKKNEFLSFLISASYLGNIYFGYLTATLYDSILLFLFLICFYYFFVEIYKKIKENKTILPKESFLLGFFASLSLLSRPDSFIAIIICYFWLFK
ncbi:hypothetical protein, partial [Caldisericum sp.]|uniref:hypothetical protein n=1 Tax=Caldisericum sp. TaxID=2499687 RepID=UPI003D0BA66B